MCLETIKKKLNAEAALRDAEKELVGLRAELEKAEARILEVVRGNFTQICSYCGFEAQPPNGWEELQTHIKECPKHPLCKAEARLKPIEEVYEKWKGVTKGSLKTNYMQAWTAITAAMQAKGEI